MNSYEWVGDVNGVQFRVSIPADEKKLATVSRWSSESEDFVESCLCAIPEIGIVMERMSKHCATRISMPLPDPTFLKQRA